MTVAIIGSGKMGAGLVFLRVWVTLTLFALLGVLTSPLAYATDGTDETTPQQSLPPTEHKGVIPPPPTGDEDIFTDAPNPEAGHEKEVIPPPDTPNNELGPRRGLLNSLL